MLGYNRNSGASPARRAIATDGFSAGVLVTVVILAAALATRIGLLTAPPEFDELYHYLAAEGWRDTGALSILDGSYTRVSGYTLAVARFLDLTGQDSLAVARIVSLVPGLALPVVLFWWMRCRVGGLAAGIASGLVVLWPQGILESQLVRFYSLHVLVFFVGAVAVYAAASGQGRARLVWAVVATVSLIVAARVQVTTVVACGGIALWLSCRGIAVAQPSPRSAWMLGAAAVIVVAGAGGLLWSTGLIEKAWAIYRFAPGNAVGTHNFAAFYHNGLRNTYETFWPLFPVAVLLALRVNAALTWFCVAIFGTVFVVQSFGTLKADRYISAAMPFFFAVWGVAGVQLASLARTALRHLSLGGAGSKPLSLFSGTSVLAACLGFMLLSNGFVITSAKLAAGGGYDAKYRPDFSGLAALLGPWRDAPFRATTHELHMVAELGDYDVDLRQDDGWAAEFDADTLFGRDPRTGRFAVRGLAGMTRLLACQRDGVLVTVSSIWGTSEIGSAFREAAAAQYLALQTRQAGPLVVVRWTDPARRTADCGDVPAF